MPKVKTKGADGDCLDVFLGPCPESEVVFVIDQLTPDGAFDEHKCMLGFHNEADARRGYLACYSPGWKGLGGSTAMTMAQFKEWIAGEETGAPLSPELGTDATGREHAPAGTAEGGQFVPNAGRGGASSFRSGHRPRPLQPVSPEAMQAIRAKAMREETAREASGAAVTHLPAEGPEPGIDRPTEEQVAAPEAPIEPPPPVAPEPAPMPAPPKESPPSPDKIARMTTYWQERLAESRRKQREWPSQMGHQEDVEQARAELAHWTAQAPPEPAPKPPAAPAQPWTHAQYRDLAAMLHGDKLPGGVFMALHTLEDAGKRIRTGKNSRGEALSEREWEAARKSAAEARGKLDGMLGD